MGKKLPVRIILNLLMAAFLLAVTGEYNGSRIPVVEALEKQSYDWRLKRDTAVKHPDITIVDIDRDTLSQYGNWPFNRGLFANLNRQLFKKYRVQIAAYALPFSQPDDTALQVLAEMETRMDNLDYLTVRRVTQALRREYSYDQHVISTIEDNPIVLGYLFDESGRVEGELPPPLQLVDAQEKTLPNSTLRPLASNWHFSTGFSGNIHEYLQAAGNAAGHINLSIDNDGIVRKSPYFVGHANSFYPSLPLAIYQQLIKKKSIAADISATSWLGGISIKNFTIGNRSAPVDRQGEMYIHYLGNGGRNVNFESTLGATFRYVSFADVVDGNVPMEHLDDKIVFIGSSSQQLRHLYPTPLNASLPGVEILATQLANLMNENILWRNGDTLFTEISVLLGLSFLLSILFATLNPVFSLLILLGVLFGYTQYALFRWEMHYEVWALLPAVITLTGLFIFNTVIGFIFERRASRDLQSTFGQYVPPEFAKKISTSGKNINMEGEERELSVLFSDVRDFTSISESLSPRDVTLLMNRMLTDLTQVIHRHDGTVDKYIGDAIMAFWNAPLSDEQHAKKSVLAAIDMQKAMQTLADNLAKGGFDKPLRLGVGICTGAANVGNMGSSLRMTYTAIGDTVNLASRTESLTKYYQCPILVTETTYKQCNKDIVFRRVDLVQVKGRQQPVMLYEPLGAHELLPPGTGAKLKQFEKMRQLYTAGDFAAAKTELDAYQKMAPSDRLIILYEQRLAMLLKNPPTEWDGVMTHESK